MKKSTLGLGVLALVLGVSAVSVGSVLAYRGEPTVHGPNYSVERHAAMTEAFENKDYDAWKDLMQGRGRVSELITADKFSQFAEAHDLALQDKIEEAQEIFEEFGLGLPNGSGRNTGGMMGGMRMGWNLSR